MSTEFRVTRPTNHNLRLETLVNVRWLAILGQTTAVLVVWLFLEFQFNALQCFVLIAASAVLNIVLGVRYMATTRLSSRASTLLLAYDMVQLAALLFLTGGLANPFSLLLLVPVFISATALPVGSTLLLGFVALVATTLLAFFHSPLPWMSQAGLALPAVYIAGMWVAVVSSLLFTSIYAFRVAREAWQLSEALAATELVLQREQHLSNLDGLAAAAAHELGTPLATIALVAKEMLREIDDTSPMRDDIKLLHSQSQRCREIMQTLTSLSEEGDRHIGIISVSVMLEEVFQTFRDFGIEFELRYLCEGVGPNCYRNPGIIHGLRNLVENAIDHAKSRVVLEAGWNEEAVYLTLTDDGPGFHEDMIYRIGEPFLQSRSRLKYNEGLGLGLFIAKTLLERSGASIGFSKSSVPKLSGAQVKIRWPRNMIEVIPPGRAF